VFNYLLLILNLKNNKMKKLKFKFFVLSLVSIGILEAETASAQKQYFLPFDTSVVSNHKITINGSEIAYEVTVGTLPVYVEHKDEIPGKVTKPRAYVQYTYYRRTGLKDVANRPILFSFNGGPGTGSLWMHIGYTGPKRLKVSQEGWPVQPYGVEDNHYSILDVTDLVFINPVNTGYSRIINDGKREDFFGVEQDVNYLADWIALFISRYDRWTSPKFLIGESYGTTRVAGLAGVLQSKQNIFLNGVVLQGNCGIGLNPSFSSAASAVFKLPSYTSAAWYHKKLPADLQSKDLDDIFPLVQDFTFNEYLPAVVRAGSLPQAQKEAIAEKVARFSGLSKQYILDHNLVVGSSAFWKELLRSEGKTIGRLDTRYVGVDKENAGEKSDYNAEILAWEHAFTPAINKYFREDLGFKTDLRYYVFGPVRPWGQPVQTRGGDNFNVGDQLRLAMAENPGLQLLNQQGYYDGACDVLGAKLSLWHLDPRSKFKDRIHFKAFKSGHMLYIRDEDCKEGNDDLRQFILNAVPKDNQPIQY
jgi:carboxypeptidase C (cathepsin A)